MSTLPPREIGRHKWLSLCVGERDEPYVISSDGVFVIPLTPEREVLFIHEPTVPDGKLVLSLPAGAVDAGEPPSEAANREMQEEIGYRASRIDFLGKLHPLARHAVWTIHVFLARDLTPSRLRGDESYAIPIERIPFDRFEALIASGRLADSTIIAGLFLARSFLTNESAHG